MRPREVNRIIEANGGEHVRTTGSHKRYRVTVGGVTASTAVPQHPGDIPTGTLSKIQSDLCPSTRKEVAPVSTYEVIVTREDGTWLADVPTVPGAHTYARTLAGLARYVREVIILMDDLDDDATPEMTFVYKVNDEAVLEAAAVGRERRQSRALEEALMAHTSAAVARLAREGYSVRDAAALLDLTPGRVSQLLNA